MIRRGKRAAERHREGLGQPAGILSAAGEAIYGLDREGRVTFVNPAALRLTGHDAADLAGRSLHGTVQHTRPDGTPNLFADCPASMSPEEGTIHSGAGDVYRRKDGTSFPVEVSATPMLDDGRVTGAVVIARNISDRLEAERAAEEVTSGSGMSPPTRSTGPTSCAGSSGSSPGITRPASRDIWSASIRRTARGSRRRSRRPTRPAGGSRSSIASCAPTGRPACSRATAGS
jgi:PAS domain S-box-containing protein